MKYIFWHVFVYWMSSGRIYKKISAQISGFCNTECKHNTTKCSMSASIVKAKVHKILSTAKMIPFVCNSFCAIIHFRSVQIFFKQRIHTQNIIWHFKQEAMTRNMSNKLSIHLSQTNKLDLQSGTRSSIFEKYYL